MASTIDAMAKARIGIVGAGRIAREHVKASIAAGSDLAAVFDVQQQQMHALIDELQQICPGHAAPVAADSFDALLDMAIDGVIVAVPPAEHADVAIRTLQAGKAVLLEKPMAMDVAQCDAILDVMHKHDAVVQLGFVCRASPKVQAVREMVRSGALGEVYHVKASMYRQRGIPGLGGWFTTKAQAGGGVLIDIGVHLIDLVMYLTGARQARTVSGMCESRFGSPIEKYVYEDMWAGPPRLDGVFDVEDSAMGFLRLDSGATCELNVAWASNLPSGVLPDGITLLGERGGLFFDLWGDRLVLTTEQDGKVVDTSPDVDTDDLWHRAWRDQHMQFVSAIKHRAVPLATARCGRAVQQVVAAWQESAEQQREVSISPSCPEEAEDR